MMKGFACGGSSLLRIPENEGLNPSGCPEQVPETPAEPDVKTPTGKPLCAVTKAEQYS
jgi:hypothetical protein